MKRADQKAKKQVAVSVKKTAVKKPTVKIEKKQAPVKSGEKKTAKTETKKVNWKAIAEERAQCIQVLETENQALKEENAQLKEAVEVKLKELEEQLKVNAIKLGKIESGRQGIMGKVKSFLKPTTANS